MSESLFCFFLSLFGWWFLVKLMLNLDIKRSAQLTNICIFAWRKCRSLSRMHIQINLIEIMTIMYIAQHIFGIN